MEICRDVLPGCYAVQSEVRRREIPRPNPSEEQRERRSCADGEMIDDKLW